MKYVISLFYIDEWFLFLNFKSYYNDKKISQLQVQVNLITITIKINSIKNLKFILLEEFG